MQTLPQQLAKALSQVLREAGTDALSDATVGRVRATIRVDEVPDYKTDWAAFSYLYYAANFAKARYLASRMLVLPKDEISILDLGCGAGAALAGVCDAISSRGVRVAEITAIDRSEEQLRLFNRVSAPWLKELLPAVAFEQVQANALDYVRADARPWDVVLMSYVLCEMPPPDRMALRSCLSERIGCSVGQWLIVDKPRKGNGTRVESNVRVEALVQDQHFALDLDFLHEFGLATLPKFDGIEKT